MVQTVKIMMFTNSSAIIGFMTSVGVNLMRLNLAALFIIVLIRHVLVNLTQLLGEEWGKPLETTIENGKSQKMDTQPKTLTTRRKSATSR